eukprot:444258-Amphidinium_carterae.1
MVTAPSSKTSRAAYGALEPLEVGEELPSPSPQYYGVDWDEAASKSDLAKWQIKFVNLNESMRLSSNCPNPGGPHIYAHRGLEQRVRHVLRLEAD